MEKKNQDTKKTNHKKTPERHLSSEQEVNALKAMLDMREKSMDKKGTRNQSQKK